jgi:pimeloyl-ACP methyl ester carboxylesterase
MAIPLVLIHGYSDSATSFKDWSDVLIQKKSLDPSRVHVINYATLHNEITIGDIAEGLDRALTNEARIAPTEEFDVIVHSTGMLVIRAWLTRYASIDSKQDQARTRRLRHLIALAPATNGSPVAHKGRSWLGALFKGNRDLGSDFLESGTEVLSALELGSRFTWDLAEKDLFGTGNTSRFKKGSTSPFVFTICGDSGLGKLADIATGAVGTKIRGSDGVVRWAGAALNSRLLSIDYTGSQDAKISASEWNNQDNTLILWPGLNHGSIMRPKTTDPLVQLVSNALDVQSDKEFIEWIKNAKKSASDTRGSSTEPHRWQQFVIRVSDERGDGVADWTISLQIKRKTMSKAEPLLIDDLHPYERDKSYRCLHVNLSEYGLFSDMSNIESLSMKLTMNTSSDYLLYVAHRKEQAKSSRKVERGLSELTVDLSDYINSGKGKFNLLMPYTTTFVEFKVNRDPSIDGQGKAKVCHVKTR